MNICDRTWKRDGQPVSALFTVVIAGPEVEEEYHLCAKEIDDVRSFINDPTRWGPKGSEGKGRKILRLSDKAKKSSGNNSAA